MNTYLKFGTLILLIVGSLVWLAVGGVKDTKSYYKTIPELSALGTAQKHARLRVAGEVKPGSITRNGGDVSFVLQQGPQTLNVVYNGSDPLPDTFKDNANAVADGRLGADGVFQANKIQAKCASKYEAKPNQRNITHETAPAARIS
jgi:cytochrome c-type biogenesis protein CcmE